MIENFLRRPRGFMDFAADALRYLAVFSIVLAALFFEPTDAGIIAFTLPGVVAPRFLGLRAGADMVFVGGLLVAAWSNIFDFYTRFTWWDMPVHLIMNGLIAWALYLLLARGNVVPDPRSKEFTRLTALALLTSLGLAVGALWEMLEWFGREFISEQIYIAYDDTIGDMAVGGLGSLIAGFVIAYVPLLRSQSAEE